MMPQGPPTPLGGAQQVPPPLLRSNSGYVGGEIPPQNMFPSLVHNQFNNSMNVLGSSLLQQPFGNGGPSTGPGPAQGGLVDGGPEPDVRFNPPPSSYNASPSMVSGNNTPSQGQPQFSSSQGIPRPNVGPVKLEQPANNEQQAFRSLGPVKLEPHMRNVGPLKMETQDSSLFLQHQQHQQQQQQQILLSRQCSATHLLHQQRLMQMQQQQQLLKAMPPQQRPSPLQSQFHAQNLPVRSPGKPVYEPGMCARRLTHYMYQQQHRPEDNNVEFWRKFVAEYFAPNAKKKWCISMYGSGRQNTGVLPQDVWHCEICNRKPGRGFEATVEVLPRLFKIKYESGTLEELLYVDMPREYQNSSGQIVLDYAKAIQESVFDELRVVRDGQLRIVFSPDLKICSWEFCARRHEELIPRRLLIPQVSQLGAAARKCQTAAAAAQNSSSDNNSVSELQNNCNTFLASARQLAKALEVPLVNDLGYTKRYVRCLQISEVVNSMKDLIDYSRETGTGPMESLSKFPRRTNPSPPGLQSHHHHHHPQQQRQITGSISNNDNNNPPLATVTSGPTTPSSSTAAIAGLIHQNSTNSRHQPHHHHQQQQQNSISGSSSPFPGNNAQPSPTTPSSSNNVQQQQHGNHGNNVPMQQQNAAACNDGANDSQSSVQKIIKSMMLSANGNAAMNGGAHVLLGNNGVLPNGGNNGHSGFGNMSNGVRGPNPLSVNGRVAMMMMSNQQQQQQHDLGTQLLGYNNLQFDWKPSP